MKIKLHHILFTFYLTMLTSAGIGVAHAQDASFYSEDRSHGESKDRTHYAPGGEADHAGSNFNQKSQLLTAKDSAALYQQGKLPLPGDTKNTKQAQEQDDSSMSFNFLYYIIRKYKLQDIMD